MAVTYSAEINRAFVRTQDTLTDVICEVEFTLIGEDSGCRFLLPASVKFAAATPDAFTPFEEVTQEQLLEWLAIESNPTIQGQRSHIALVLEQMVAKAQAQVKPLPWQPTPVTPTPPPE